MPGLGKQGKKKGIARSADMSIEPPPAATWDKPPDEECSEQRHPYLVPPGADAGRERVFVRTVTHDATGALVEFAVGHQTFFKGSWRDVFHVDACHPDEVHAHRYGRKAGTERVGNPERLMEVASIDDVALGYALARERVLDNWRTNRERWTYA